MNRGKMRCAVYLGPGQMELQERDIPEPKENEVLVRVRACAVCGTDIRIFTYGQKNVIPPQIIGHEIAGVIEEVGNGLKNDYKEGGRVTVVTCVSCGKCKFCERGWYNLCDTPRYIGYYYPGGYAEYMIVPEEAVKGGNVIVVKDERLSFPEISMIEPLSCCINGQEYLNISGGESVVIFGSGPIGCMHSELAAASGAEKIIMVDISQKRLDLAKKQNIRITDFINSSVEDTVGKVLELTSGRGADVVIVACSSKEAQEQALQIASKKARISFFAGLSKDDPYIKFDSNIVHYKEVAVYGAFASYKRQYEKALELISSGKIDAKKFITHEFKLDDILSAFEVTKSGEGLKSVVTIQ